MTRVKSNYSEERNGGFNTASLNSGVGGGAWRHAGPTGTPALFIASLKLLRFVLYAFV